ncbi:MAG: tyrosine-type recombinase/integrase [Ardenticatenaceae bacterium]|nr:tyrosine-type recombinase/integrase [Ardenticatenaceae bacterium]
MFNQITEFVNWHRRRNPQARTWRDYFYDLKQFVEVVGNRDPLTITVTDIDRFVKAQFKRGLSPKTINRRLTTLISFYTYLSDTNPEIVCPVLPYRHFLKERKRLPRPLPTDEVKRFFDAIDNVRDRAMFTLMLRCGLRISEVASLRVVDLFLNEVRPRMVVMGKNSRERTVYLSFRTVKLIRRYLAERESDAEDLFVSYQDKGLSTTAIHKRLMVYRQRAGINLTAHQLRHTFATDLLEQDVPLPTIQKLMGHAWVTTTQTYLLVSEGKIANDFYRAAAEMGVWA